MSCGGKKARRHTCVFQEALLTVKGRPRLITSVTPSSPTSIWFPFGTCTIWPALRSVRSSLYPVGAAVPVPVSLLLVALVEEEQRLGLEEEEEEAVARGGGAERPRGCSEVGVGSKRGEGATTRPDLVEASTGLSTGVLLVVGTVGMALALVTCRGGSEVGVVTRAGLAEGSVGLSTGILLVVFSSGRFPLAFVTCGQPNGTISDGTAIHGASTRIAIVTGTDGVIGSLPISAASLHPLQQHWARKGAWCIAANVQQYHASDTRRSRACKHDGEGAWGRVWPSLSLRTQRGVPAPLVPPGEDKAKRCFLHVHG